MASKLSYYKGSSSNRSEKFIRSVNSFLLNTYPNKELIIISDNCDITEKIYNNNYKDIENIKFIYEKSSGGLFRGLIREIGVKKSDGDIITFLDTDDELLPNHLDIISNNFNIDKNDWIYFNNYVRRDNGKYYLRESKIERAYIGTSNIAYKKNVPVTWEDCDGYGHDWNFIKKLVELNVNYKKVSYSGYIIRHLLDGVDN